MLRNRLIYAIALAALVVLVSGADINRSLRIEEREVLEGDQSTLNGSISIGDGAIVRGVCESVNGRVSLGRDAQVQGISSVNGNVTVGEGSVVDEGVSAVNGRVTLERGSRAAEVRSINGTIRLTGADIAGNVETINGDMLLRDATVDGDIVIEERRGSKHRRRPQQIELEDGTVIRGSVLNRDPDIRVEVYLRGGSRIEGRVENVQVIEE